MLTFFADLDHTLIYSHRSKPDVGCVLIETLGNMPQSYMTEKTWNALTDMADSGKVCIVPVTTRNEKQYNRLNSLTDRLHIPYALICNGAVLLDHGTVDDKWLKESVSIAGDELEELAIAENEVRALCGEDKTHFPFGLMVYGGSDNSKQDSVFLKGRINRGKCIVSHDRRKIYCIPVSLNKGMAVKRFQDRFGYETSISAGDSELDIPMLRETDYAVFPETLLSPGQSDRHFSVSEGQILSDALCDILQHLTDKK